MNALTALFRRDLQLLWRNRGDALLPALFLILIVALFPLGISPDPDQLRLIAPGVIWIAALLAALLGLSNLFREDRDDGSLDQLLIADAALPAIVLVRLLAHWLGSLLPLILLSPLLGLWLNLPAQAMGVLVGSLLLGTPVLLLLGGVGVALTISLRQSGQLLAILVFPLMVPVLIFGTSAVNSASLGMAYDMQLLLLLALLVFTLSTAPFAAATALRISQE